MNFTKEELILLAEAMSDLQCTCHSGIVSGLFPHLKESYVDEMRVAEELEKKLNDLINKFR